MKRSGKQYHHKSLPKCRWTPEQVEKIRELAKWFTHFERMHGRVPTQAEINIFGKTQEVV